MPTDCEPWPGKSHIRIEGRKGGAAVAAAIMHGLVDLAWQAYGENSMGIG